uniref:Uncharacterized protein n=1 Tax=Timema monikensis TaxID=170555 RepID=A0A7R9EM27_9NEOP|nr:unnamed protein product [Timema monikensis]
MGNVNLPTRMTDGRIERPVKQFKVIGVRLVFARLNQVQQLRILSLSFSDWGKHFRDFAQHAQNCLDLLRTCIPMVMGSSNMRDKESATGFPEVLGDCSDDNGDLRRWVEYYLLKGVKSFSSRRETTPFTEGTESQRLVNGRRAWTCVQNQSEGTSHATRHAMHNEAMRSQSCMARRGRGNRKTTLRAGQKARVIETHGKFGEYLNTTSAEFIDEFNDMAVYMADIPIAQPSSECSLKFARLKNIDKMWLYGIHLSIQKVMPPAQTEACVNFQHVNRLLKESTLQLTEKAEKCKRFLQLYSSNTDPSKNASKRLDPQMLLKMFESQYLDQYTHLEDKAKCVTKSLAEMLPVFTRGLKEKSQHCIEDKTQLKEELKINSCDTSLPINLKTTEQNTPNYFVDLFKEYINKRFLECEKNILSRVEEKLDALEKKQDEKFDSILKQLKLLGSSTVNTL